MMMLMMLKQMQTSIKQNMAKAPPEMQEQQKMLLQMSLSDAVDDLDDVFFIGVFYSFQMFLAVLGLSKLQENDGKLAEQFVCFSSHTRHGRISQHFTTR